MKVKIIKKIKDKKRRRKKGEKKENYKELQKPNIDAEVYNNNKKCDCIYTHTYIDTCKQNQNSSTKSTIAWPGEHRKPKIIPTRTKLTKAQTGKQN